MEPNKWSDQYAPRLMGKCIVGPRPMAEECKWSCVEYDSEAEAWVAHKVALFHYYTGSYYSWQKEENLARWALE